MKFWIGIVFLFVAVGAFGQEYPDSGFTNKAEAKNLMLNGLKEGKWVEYQDMMGNFNTDKHATYYVLTVYKKGVINGIAWRYYNNGKLHAKIYYTNGKMNGVARYYFKNKKLMSETTYHNDTIIGVEKYYYESGKLNGETPYLNGEIDGIEKEYYESGKLQSETIYTNGVKGTTKNYDENGNKIKQ